MHDSMRYKTHWIIRKYADDEAFKKGEAFDESTIEGNLMLNEGIDELWDILIGAGGTTLFDTTNSQLGVGDGTTAEAATQTDLVGVNTLYKGMETGYPQRSAETVTWRSVFTGTEANFAWNEFTVRNGATALKNLNRKVSAQGTKTSGQTWTLDLQITLS